MDVLTIVPTMLGPSLVFAMMDTDLTRMAKDVMVSFVK